MMHNKTTTIRSKTFLAFMSISFKNFFFQKMTKISLISFCTRRVSMNIRWVQFTPSHFRQFFSSFFRMFFPHLCFTHSFPITRLRAIFSSPIFNSIWSSFHVFSAHITGLGKGLSVSLKRPSIQRRTLERTTLSFVSFEFRSGLKCCMTIGAYFFDKLWKTGSGKITEMRTILRCCFFRSKWFETLQTCFHRYWNYTTNILSIQ